MVGNIRSQSARAAGLRGNPAQEDALIVDFASRGVRRATRIPNGLEQGTPGQPELAGHRLSPQPDRSGRDLRVARPLHRVGPPGATPRLALFQPRKEPSALRLVGADRAADAVFGANERAVLLLVQRLLQRHAGPVRPGLLVHAGGVRRAGHGACGAGAGHLLPAPGLPDPLADLADPGADGPLAGASDLLSQPPRRPAHG